MQTAAASTVHASALGNLRVEASGAGVTRVAFTDDAVTAPIAENSCALEHLVEALVEIDGYLAGTRREFTVPLDRPALSAFDRTVLETLEATTAYGRTTTYGALARALGRGPADARKVGGALSRNPLLILIPCHRVLGADGALTGYAGGLAAKRALLDLESADLRLPLAI
ncbi:methylated-DNA-[protein]-cysteine S-methyltransferase [Nocardia tenerifensis]|uniref:methylated-DNA--[protein]-cysteine S-methyltransferase n=1 Tax=Nocardia tenerifensis TaxID=228006 RepID=A0A318JWP0_9NOCA|nr:methylated-DNA--[protein]-cysteine S-methyltransferase [Nocardia tenerifensis]PXX59151.1 methylated-DNA-[protein]-cysteine S-methyltransferase [Nocardia tenerifensis]